MKLAAIPSCLGGGEFGINSDPVTIEVVTGQELTAP